MDLFIRQVVNEHKGDWAQTTKDIETFLNEMARMAGKQEDWGYIRVEIPAKTNTASYDTCHGFVMLENPENNEQVIKLVNNTLYKGRRIIVAVQRQDNGTRMSTLKKEHQESRSRSTSRTRQGLDWERAASATKRKADDTDEDAKALKNKVAKLTLQVKELELQALKLDQAKEEEEEMSERMEQEKLRLQNELRIAVTRINQVEQERNELQAENNALKRKVSELCSEASLQEARNAIKITTKEASKQAESEQEGKQASNKN